MKSAGSRSLVALVLIVAAVGCKKDGAVAHPGQAGGGAMPALFASVPAETPYLIASSGPAPAELYAKIRDALGPAFGRLIARERAKDPNPVADAIFAELEGKWNQAGFASLGLSPDMRFAIYGLGLQPVVARVELRDDKAVLATLQRIAARAGKPLPPMLNQGGRSYWRTDEKGTSIVLEIADNQLVVAVGQPASVSAKLDLILGTDKPSRSLADGVMLGELMAKHGFGPHLLGFVNSHGTVAAALEQARAKPTAACTAEIDRLSARMPRVVWGYTEVSANKLAGGIVFELAPDLVAELKAIKTELPGYTDAMGAPSLFAMALALDAVKGQPIAVGAARSFKRLGDACGLAELSAKAGQAAQAMAQPLPDPVARVSGALFVIKDMTLPKRGEQMPDKLEGVVSISSLDAKVLLDKIGEIVPVKLLGLSSDGKLHAMGAGMLPVKFPVNGGVGARNIVITSGTTTGPLGEKLLGARTGGKAPLYALSYDLGWLLDLALKNGMEGDANAREMAQAFRNLLGPIVATLDVTDAGISGWSEIHLK